MAKANKPKVETKVNNNKTSKEPGTQPQPRGPAKSGRFWKSQKERLEFYF